MIYTLKDKTVLITQHRLVDFTGSEIITLELSEYFSSQGAKVIVATERLANPIAAHFKKLKNVQVIQGLESDALDNALASQKIDIAWIHHQIIPPALLGAATLNRMHFIFNHMSAYHFQEFPIFYSLEDNIADQILFNSPETMNKIVETGVLNKDDKKLFVLGNPAPESFFKLRNTEPNRQPQKILIVSNHIPPELARAVSLLRKMNVEVEIAGVSHSAEGTYQRVTPKLIQGSDVVVSIGKTVQYSLASQVPIYCYDHFGGPGYLNDANYSLAQDRNFSGRGFKKKTEQVIVKELIEGYGKALIDIKILNSKYAKEFSVDSKISQLLQEVCDSKLPSKKVAPAMISAYNKFFEFIISFLQQQNERDEIIEKYRLQEATNSKLNHKLESSIAKLKELNEEKEELQKQLVDLKNSKTYKAALKLRDIKNTLQLSRRNDEDK